MMHMPWVLMALIAFLVVLLGAALAAVRVLGAGTVKRDHPRTHRP
jgi:hypothetical protein